MIYAIQAGQQVKIGCAKNPRARRSEIQVCCPEECIILGVCDGNQKHEKELHQNFSHARVRGEWFELTPDIASWIDANMHPLPELPEPDRSNCGRPPLPDGQALSERVALRMTVAQVAELQREAERLTRSEGRDVIIAEVIRRRCFGR